MEFAGTTSNVALPITDADKNLPFIEVDPLKIRPVDCRVVAKKITQGDRSKGGIFLPHGEDKQRQLTLMEIVKVGDGRTTDHGVHIKVRVKPGDVVIVGKFAGSPVPNNEDYKILNEAEILAVQEK